MSETHSQKRAIGYARVSTYGQTLDSQLEQLRGRMQRLEHLPGENARPSPPVSKITLGGTGAIRSTATGTVRPTTRFARRSYSRLRMPWPIFCPASIYHALPSPAAF